MPDDKQQQTVDWQNDPDFHALPLADKHKVLLQVDPDYKGLPAKEQAKALDVIHYGSLGQISGTGDFTGAGTSFVDTLKGMLPQDPTGGAPILSKKFWVGDNTVKIHPSQGGIAQMGKEAQAEYQRARGAGAGPLTAGFSSGVAAAASPFVSNIKQMGQAEQGESGQILGESAAPVAVAAAAPLIGRAMGSLPTETAPSTGGISADTTGAAGRYLLSKSGIHGSGYVGEKIGRLFGNEGAITPEAAKAAAKAQAKAEAAAAKADAAARKAIPVSKGPGPYKGPSSVPPPNPFAGMTSSATPIGNAELPPVPAAAPITTGRPGGYAPPPTIEAPQTGGPLDLSPQPKTSVLSRAKTPIELGVEPDMNNPTHVKMINDIIGQGLNEAAIKKLKVRANFGDRFAKVALDYWRSKEGR